ncbi:nicotinate phosphoribosyltransferase [Candidatus Mycoplasma haematominutum]|uniref:Nicotinate phosphoribosyltransferase n=1 Tax=Candidatus Mycoplasma haematominutum 'Birmingham 1' TaxID=1116213 RepID=G8C2X4_9MOLU|nr:nicotinate phosphoribosyltransferase [Candidatus Mycoplasma haematominutum]CCE66672.1 nicotinate phosphoribosyltransferase [Candidatus Mycoplasma haematominutum 'Birmingham 1']
MRSAQIKRVISTYFFDAQKLSKAYSKEEVIMQFFQREDNAILSGIQEVLELLTPDIKGQKIKVRHLEEGRRISSWEVVLELQGLYEHISIYEGLIDGILSRSSSLATNARLCIEASQGVEIICMADRSDHYRNIEADCWSYYIGGIRSFSAPNLTKNKFYRSLSAEKREKIKVYHSLPHGAIQIFRGNTLKAMEAYLSTFPKLPMVALVDFNNNIVKETLELFQRFGKKLKAVRVDTSKEIKDISLAEFPDTDEYKGVNITLIQKLRKALDEIGGTAVKIYLSSGFTPESISKFISSGVKVDGFGVGQFLTRVNIFFTGDLVKLGDSFISKAGRGYRENAELKEFSI